MATKRYNMKVEFIVECDVKRQFWDGQYPDDFDMEGGEEDLLLKMIDFDVTEGGFRLEEVSTDYEIMSVTEIKDAS